MAFNATGVMNGLSSKWAELYTSGEHSDCVIISGLDTYKVHSMVVIGQSDYFKAALKPGVFKEGNTGVIDLKDLPTNLEDQSDADGHDDPKIIKLMIYYFYHFAYSCDNPGSTDQTSTPDASVTPNPADLITHAKVFATAVKYQVDQLRNLAAENFRIMVADKYDGDGRNAFKDATFCDAFAEAVTFVFLSTSEQVTQLRDIVLETLLDNFEQLRGNPAIEDAMQHVPSYDLWRRQHLKPSPYYRSESFFTCKICRQVKCEQPVPESAICDRCSSRGAELPAE